MGLVVCLDNMLAGETLTDSHSRKHATVTFDHVIHPTQSCMHGQVSRGRRHLEALLVAACAASDLN